MKSRNLLFFLAFLTVLLWCQKRAAAQQNSLIDSTLAAGYFQEANHLCRRDAGKLWNALSAALVSSGKDRWRAIADALLFRACRQTIFPAAAEEERQMEMHEGLAEYTGVKLSDSPNPNRFVIDRDIRETAQKQSFVRSFAYASSPAYGVLLDETKVDWRKNLKKEDDLAILLQKYSSIKLPPLVEQAVAARAKKYDADKLQAFEIKRENNRRKLLAGYRAKFVDNAILRLPIFQMSMQMNPGSLTPLDSIETVYPNIRIVDASGILTAANRALIKSDFSSIRVSAPNRSTAQAAAGDGWTLELNRGWTLTQGERKGDYTVKKVER